MIDSFVGKHYFLSNFYPATITFDGICYRNNEAAFQAQKTLDHNQRLEFSKLTASDAKKLGRQVTLRKDWERVKTDLMYQICLAKFTQNEDLKTQLIATRNEYLEEGNTWGDKVWGTVDGVGENRLGKILMRVREEVGTNFDMYIEKEKCVKWIRDFFEKNGNGCNAVIGISGGKDSSVVAALCVEALGKDRVIGVLMPNGKQSDIEDSLALVEHLGIKFTQVNIKLAFDGVLNEIQSIETLYALDNVAPGTANDDTLLYGCESKYYSIKPCMTEQFEVMKNAYVVGDCSGVCRGLSHSAAMGLYVAENLLKKI